MDRIYEFSEDQSTGERWCATECHRGARGQCTQGTVGHACVPWLRERIASLESEILALNATLQGAADARAELESQLLAMMNARDEGETRERILEAEVGRLREETRPASLLSRVAMLAAQLDESRLLLAASYERGARDVLRFHYSDSEELELSLHVDGIVSRFFASRGVEKMCIDEVSAREFAEWCDCHEPSWNVQSVNGDIIISFGEALARFLASRGTAEKKEG